MSTSAAQVEAPQKREISIIDLLGRFAPLIFLLGLVAVLSYLEPGFRTERNVMNVLRQV
jgi:predicted ABC-type sugar transport system permease subunit